MAQSHVVYVGNLPSDTKEEELVMLFLKVGPVVSLRLVHDKNTGKPKGFGYVEYASATAAASAMRNLNGREYHGRALRVDTMETMELLEQSLKLTPQQVALLPPSERAQIEELRASFGPRPVKRARNVEEDVDVDEVILPPPQKKQKTDKGEVLKIKQQVSDALKVARDVQPVKVTLTGPLSLSVVTELKEWARRQGYFLHYKEKLKHVDDDPNDIHHEGRMVKVFTIRMYE